MALNFNQPVCVLAPMVRVSTLPMRLLALDYGADAVYVEEIIDRRLLTTKRVVNELLGTVDFVQLDGTVVFRTCAKERDRVVLQLGTADPERAVAAAKMVEADVAAVDVNMGCPKDYSTKGGMGAALLSNPDRAVAILKALVANLSIPVCCKIRILPTTADTIALAKSLAATGIAWLAVHGRLREERPRHPNHNEEIAAVSAAVSIPVLANGGSGETVKLPSDVAYFRHVTGAKGVMLARAAMHNPSIFCAKLNDQLVEDELLVKQFIKYAASYDNPFPQSKYCVQQLLHQRTETKKYRQTLSAQTWQELCELWDLGEWYRQLAAKRSADEEQQQQQQLGQQQLQKRKLQDDTGVEDAAAAGSLNQEPLSKKRLTIADSGDVLASFRFYRRQYLPDSSPKMLLHSHCIQQKLPQPVYKTELVDRLYYSQVAFDGCVYRNLLGDQSKKYAEQSAACICLVHLGLHDGRRPSTESQLEH